MITLEDILQVHEVALTVGRGGATGVRSMPQLLAAINLPFQSAGGEDAYPTMQAKAAALAYALAEGQPFIDGNKRTAALAMLLFLRLQGYRLDLTYDLELADVFIAVGSRQLSRDDFFAWVAKRTSRGHGDA